MIGRAGYHGRCERGEEAVPDLARIAQLGWTGRNGDKAAAVAVYRRRHAGRSL